MSTFLPYYNINLNKVHVLWNQNETDVHTIALHNKMRLFPSTLLLCKFTRKSVSIKCIILFK